MPTWCSRFSTSGFFRATLKKLGGGEHQLGTFLITLRCSPVVLVDMAHAPGLLQLWLDDGRSRCWVNEMPRPGRSKRRWRYAALGLGGGAQHVGLCLRAAEFHMRLDRRLGRWNTVVPMFWEPAESKEPAEQAMMFSTKC